MKAISERWAADRLQSMGRARAALDMGRKERFALYEKLYFHELERREKLNARLALPFAVLVATASLLSFLLQSGAKPLALPYATYFWPLLTLSSLSLAVAAWFFRKAWYGHSDNILPIASAMEAYHDLLVKTYEGYETRDQLVGGAFEAFLFGYYIQCSSNNAVSNDSRATYIYRTLVSLTLAVLLAFGASIPFFLGTYHGPNRSTSATSATAARA